jgi:hypothetical protein
MTDIARLRHDVGGPALLDRRWLLLLVPTSLVTSLLTRGVVDLRSLLGWSAANVIAFGVCWSWVALFDATMFRARAQRPMPLTAVVTFGASLGALKGAMTDLSGVALGLGSIPAIETVWRSIGTAALGAVAIPAAAALKVAVERYRTEHALLVAQLLHGINAGSGDEARACGAASSSTSDLHDFASEARAALAASSPEDAAATVLALVDDRLRPYTHQLWARGDAPHRPLDLRSVLVIALRRSPLPYGAIVLPYALSVWPVSVELTGPLAGTLRAVIAGVTLLGVLILARTLRPQAMSARLAGVHLAATVLVATGVQMLQWDRLFGGMPRPSTPGLWFTVAAWLAVLIVVAGAVAVALQARAALRAEVLRAIGPEALRSVAMRDHDRLAAQRIATRLHADLQGQLIAAARRIEELGDDPPARAAELATIDRILEEIPSLGSVPSQAPVGDQLTALEDRWRGFLDLRIVCAPEVVGAASSLQDKAVQVVSEAVVNAARHGLATRVSVELDASGEGVDVRVTDDGIGPRDGTPGLGSTYFAAVSGGEWSLVANAEGGSMLRVRLTG